MCVFFPCVVVRSCFCKLSSAVLCACLLQSQALFSLVCKACLLFFFAEACTQNPLAAAAGSPLQPPAHQMLEGLHLALEQQPALLEPFLVRGFVCQLPGDVGLPGAERAAHRLLRVGARSRRGGRGCGSRSLDARQRSNRFRCGRRCRGGGSQALLALPRNGLKIVRINHELCLPRYNFVYIYIYIRLWSPKPGHTTGGSGRHGAGRTAGRGDAGQNKVPTVRWP